MKLGRQSDLPQQDLADQLLTDRLTRLLPGLDGRQIAAACQSVRANLAATVGDAAASAPAIHALAPTLTDTELVVLVLAPTDANRRPAVAPASRILLEHASACVREATLDALLDPAPATSSRALARIGRAGPPAPATARPAPPAELLRIDETALLEAVQDDDEDRAVAILAAASGLPERAIQHVAELRSAKALVSLAWKCGFTMRAAIAVQILLGQLPPSQMLRAGPAGRYPLSRDEMEWFIEVFYRPPRAR